MRMRMVCLDHLPASWEASGSLQVIVMLDEYRHSRTWEPVSRDRFPRKAVVGADMFYPEPRLHGLRKDQPARSRFAIPAARTTTPRNSARLVAPRLAREVPAAA